MSSTRGKNDPGRNENDLYETPRWCIDVLVQEMTEVLPPDKCYEWSQVTLVDVGAGDGRIGIALKAKYQGHQSRLVLVDVEFPPTAVYPVDAGVRRMEMDYLKLDLGQFGQPLALVGNPPFSLADEIVMKSVEWMKHGGGSMDVAAFLLRLNWLGSEKRADWVNRYPPDRMVVLAPRPSFCTKTRVVEGVVKKSSNDSCEYAWMFWNGSGRGGTMKFRVAKWAASREERKIARKAR